MKRIILAAAAAAAFGIAAPAAGHEIFGGLYLHDVKTPLDLAGVEGGVDAQLGWRGGAFGKTPLQPYAFASANSAGKTHYAAAGITAKFGGQVFVRPGVGIAVHTGSAQKFEDPNNGKVDFGSRILFEPELGLGVRLDQRTSVEASWIHMSHGQVFARENPGMDNLGLRLSLKLP